MKYEKTLLAFKEDIEHRGLADWLEAHTSFMRPLHRYYGTLNANNEQFSFSGSDEKKGGQFSLVINMSDITDIHLGYDSIFKRIEDRSLGLFHFVPLRINFTENHKEVSIYLFANYSSIIRHSDNQQLFGELMAYREALEKARG
jgi:hypothetical protein